MTQEQKLILKNKIRIAKIKREIQECKDKLSASDYQAIKYAEGWINESDYAPIKAQRQLLRDRINLLESQLVNS